MHLLETVAGGLSLAGFVMISAGKRSGFGVGLMASVCGLVLFLEHEMYGMAALQVAYVLVNLRALARSYIGKGI